MSIRNQISIEIAEEVIESVLEKLQECKNELAPFLQALTDADRRGMLKLGDRSIPTVQKVKSYVDTNPEFLPGYMSKEEFLKDEKVVTQLSPVVNILRQLTSDVSDTQMLAGSEAFQAALLYYGQVREADQKGVTSAKPIYQDLKQRFSKKK
ncbi:hypothetical protein [Aquimarina algicola]|uniref:Uncharacterized protein n=1 Tax=Aquimarina algicola TaxID=2589995 RepID=A0A504J761_9FLAO|nr:hypothetical protein [Aquimarina algicola]TPN84445.1 hypothetical protein FHK87_16055 [Aquimarina algicola]